MIQERSMAPRGGGPGVRIADCQPGETLEDADRYQRFSGAEDEEGTPYEALA